MSAPTIIPNVPWVADMRQGTAYMSYVPTSLWYSNPKTAAAIVRWMVQNFNSGWEDVIWFIGGAPGGPAQTFRITIGDGVSCCDTNALCYDEGYGCSSGASPIYPPLGWAGQTFFAASMWSTTGYIAYATYQVSPSPTIQITTVGLSPINVTSQVTTLGNTLDDRRW